VLQNNTIKVKRQLTKWERIFANPISDKAVPEYIKNSYNSFNNKIWAEDWVGMSPENICKCPTST